MPVATDLHMVGSRREEGFSLIETLIATAIMTTGAGVLAGLAGMSLRANQAGATATLATILAAEQAEVLYSQLAVAGPSSLAPSPSDALAVNAAGYADFFDAGGGPLGSGPSAPIGAAFVRRWSVQSLPGGPGAARLLRVVVLRWPQAAGLTSEEARRSELVRLVLVEAGT